MISNNLIELFDLKTLIALYGTSKTLHNYLINQKRLWYLLLKCQMEKHHDFREYTYWKKGIYKKKPQYLWKKLSKSANVSIWNTNLSILNVHIFVVQVFSGVRKKKCITSGT